MTKAKKALVVGIAAIASALVVAAPAGADPADNPCQLGVTVLCHFLPMAPDLDHDIDLTQGSATLNGQQLPQSPTGDAVKDGLPPADPCPAGCS